MTSIVFNGRTYSIVVTDGQPLFCVNHTTPSSLITLSNREQWELDENHFLLACDRLISNGLRIGKFFRPTTLFISPEYEHAARGLPLPISVEVNSMITDRRWIIADTTQIPYEYSQLTPDTAEFGIQHGLWAFCSNPS